MSLQMIRTKNDLPESTRKKMAELLNARVADALDLCSHAKHAHWNVRGARFLSLHELFDKVAEMALPQSDHIAERAGQLGSEVLGTMRMGAKATSLREYPHNLATGDDHLEAMAESLAAYGKNVREAIDTAEKADDADTADMFTEISREVDQMLWFVDSHRPPQEAAPANGTRAKTGKAPAKKAD